MAKLETYFGTICSEIPIEYLKEFILDFLIGASADMGQEFDRNTTPGRVFDILTTHYSHLPLSLVMSAFKHGALGQYGAGRLVPRTIFGWLGEIDQYYITIRDKKNIDYAMQEKFNGLEKYPMGKAICCKIDWLKSGAITEDEWDRIPLKQVAEIIGRGGIPLLQNFGINK